MRLKQYQIVKTEQDLLDLDAFLMDEEGNPRFSVIAIDTETNGLAHWKDVVIGFSLSTDTESGYYVPLLNWVPDLTKTKTKKDIGIVYPEGQFIDFWEGSAYPENVNSDEWKAPGWVSAFIERWFKHADVNLIMHNGPFDCLMIEKNFGVDLSLNLACDTVLLKHVLNENDSRSLKEIAKQWQVELGIPADEEANKEQIELGGSILKNGGSFTKAEKSVWRADLDVLGKYAIADTFLTYGVFLVGSEKFEKGYEPKHLSWFYDEEVMPLCKEVVIPMKRKGVNIDVEHFKTLQTETVEKLLKLEDSILKTLHEGGLLEGFAKGKTVDASVTKKKLVEEIIRLEGLEYPTANVGKKSLDVTARSLSKKAIENSYNKEPHWLWSYLLGEGVMKYDEAQLKSIKDRLYEVGEGRRYQFNINSLYHLRWLFCTKLNQDPAKLPQTDSATKLKPIPKMDAEVLEEHFLKKFPFVKNLLLYKKLDKLRSTYIFPANKLNWKGVLYMDMRQDGTSSGRFACKGGFNLQTLPKVEDHSRCVKCGSKKVTIKNEIKLLATVTCTACLHVEEDLLCPSTIKEGFIPPKDMVIVNADYSSLEPRCFSEMSGDSKIKDVYFKNLDFYSKLYCDMEDPTGIYSPDPKADNFLKKLAPHLRDMIKPVCFPAGTKVKTVSGYKNIEQIKVGDSVITKHGPKIVTNTMSRDASEIITLYTNRQVVHATPDHPIWDVRTASWKLAELFEVGDVTEFLGEKTDAEEPYATLPVFSNASFKNGATSPLFKLTFDENWAWILGAFLGDGTGCYTRREKSAKRGHNSHLISTYIGICGLEHDNIVDEFLKRLEAFGYRLSQTKIKAVTGGNFATYICHDFELAKIFQTTFEAIKTNERTDRGGKNLRVANFVLNSSVSVRLAFLAGLLDTDGYLKLKKGKRNSDIAICSKSPDFASDIGQLLSSLGIGFSLNLQFNKTYNRNYYTIVFSANGVRAAQRIGLGNYLICKRKKAAVEGVASEGFPSVYRIAPGTVRKIERSKGSKVYDITVEGVHEFIANDMRVHNCLGIPYGARAGQTANLMGFKIMVEYGGVPKEVLDVKRGAAFRDKYLATYPDLHAYMIKSEADANALGFVETVVGRRRHFKFTVAVFNLLKKADVDYEHFLDEKRKNLTHQKYNSVMNQQALQDLLNELGIKLFDPVKKEVRDWSFVQAMYKNELNNAKNFRIQGLAAHICNLGMLGTMRGFKEAGINGWVCLNVHDEITSYIHQDSSERAVEIQQKAMENNIYTKLVSVPMIAEPLIAKNLKESK